MKPNQRKELDLAHPEKYWQKKRILHAFIALSLIILIISGLSTLISFFYTQSKLTSIIASTNSQNIVLTIAILTLLSSFSFYGLRLFIRLLFHQMSLWADAADRVIACRTFVANKDCLSESNRELLFQRIFKGNEIVTLDNVEPKPNDILKNISSAGIV